MALPENGKCYSVLHYKNKYDQNFRAFKIKTDSRNMLKSREFRWQNSVKPIQEVQFFFAVVVFL